METDVRYDVHQMDVDELLKVLESKPVGGGHPTDEEFHTPVESPMLSLRQSASLPHSLMTTDDVPTVLLDGKNTQSDRREVNRTVLSG